MSVTFSFLLALPCSYGVRVSSCVYKMGCEWREQKAAEAFKKAAGILVQEDPFANSVPGLDMSSYAARRSS